MQIQIQTQIQIVIWVDMHLCIPPIYLFVLDDAKREGFLVPPTPRATKFNIFLLLKCYVNFVSSYLAKKFSNYTIGSPGTASLSLKGKV